MLSVIWRLGSATAARLQASQAISTPSFCFFRFIRENGYYPNPSSQVNSKLPPYLFPCGRIIQRLGRTPRPRYPPRRRSVPAPGRPHPWNRPPDGRRRRAGRTEDRRVSA